MLNSYLVPNSLGPSCLCTSEEGQRQLGETLRCFSKVTSADLPALLARFLAVKIVRSNTVLLLSVW